MIIVENTLKRLLRNKLGFLLILIVPVAFIGAVLGIMNWGREALVVGLTDLDQTEFTRSLEEMLSHKAIVYHVKEDQIPTDLANGRIDYALVMEKGFTDDILAGREPSIYSYSIQESNLALPVRLNLDAYIRAARNIALAAGGDRDVFYSGLEYYRDSVYIVETEQHELDRGKDVGTAVASMGLLGLNMLFLAMFATISLIRDRENRTLYRILVSPLSQRSYMLQSIFSFLVVMLLQLAGVFFVAHYVFQIYFGLSIPNLLLVMAVFSVVCVAFGVALSTLARTTRQAGAASSLLIVPMCMLGGLLWPREIMPVFLQNIGQLMPTAWMIDAATKVVNGSSLTGVGWEIMVMLLYALVFFLLGSWRRVDLARH